MGTSTSTPMWFTRSPRWTSTPDNHKFELLSPKKPSDSTPDVTLEEVIEKSSKFPRKFPIESVRCHELLKNNVPKQVLEENINSVYPVIHEHALYLCSIFLNYQKKYGNRDFYEDMTLLDLIERFLSKRAVSFLGHLDHYQLLAGTEATGGWESVGTENEVHPLVLENCLSYDEMKLSALLSVSSHTYFINDGNRGNRGVFEPNREKIQDGGVIIGLIGTRLHKEKVMEYREIVKSESQNNHQYGYGNFLLPTLQGHFLNFYGDTSATYNQLSKQMSKSRDRYKNLGHGLYFDKLVYSRRISLSIDTLLIEANDRAKKLNKMAYVHVVGLGLGVWKILHEQNKIFMDTFAERLEFLSDVLENISDVRFAYIAHKMAGPYKNGESLRHIKLHMIDQKGPHEKLEETEGKLLVVSYAWDSNSLPGNEFWFGSLVTSSDPAAACSTQVAELHNWHINKKLTGENLRVATLKGLVSFWDYQEMHKDD